jgi:hypothetical protein
MDKHPGEKLLDDFGNFAGVVTDILTMSSNPLSSAATKKILTANASIQASIAEMRALTHVDDDDVDDDDIDPADADHAARMAADLDAGPKSRTARGRRAATVAPPAEDPPPPPPEDPPPPPPPAEDDPPPPPPPPADAT